MKIEQDYIGQELIGPAQAAEILGVGRANILYYLEREDVRFFQVGSGRMFFRSEVEQAAASRAEKAKEVRKAETPKSVLRRGMREGDIEVQEAPFGLYITLWQAGASLGLSQAGLSTLRKKSSTQVYFHKGVRYMLKSDLQKLANVYADDDLF